MNFEIELELEKEIKDGIPTVKIAGVSFYPKDLDQIIKKLKNFFHKKYTVDFSMNGTVDFSDVSNQNVISMEPETKDYILQFRTVEDYTTWYNDIQQQLSEIVNEIKADYEFYRFRERDFKGTEYLTVHSDDYNEC